MIGNDNGNCESFKDCKLLMVKKVKAKPKCCEDLPTLFFCAACLNHLCDLSTEIKPFRQSVFNK